MKKLFTFLLFAFLLSSMSFAIPTDYIWSNPISGSGGTAYSKGDWNTSTNWTPNGVPTTGDNITIDFTAGTTQVWIYNVPNVQIGNMNVNIGTRLALTGQNNGGSGFSTMVIEGHNLRTLPITADVIVFDGAALYMNGTSNGYTEPGVVNYPVKLEMNAGSCFTLWHYGEFYPADFALASCSTENPGFLLKGASETNSAQFVQQIGNTQVIRGAVEMKMLTGIQHLICFPVATSSYYTTPADPSNICGMRNTLCVCQTDVVAKWGITAQSWQGLGNETCFTAATQIEPGKGYRIGGDGVTHPGFYHMPMGPLNNGGSLLGIDLKPYLPGSNNQWALVGNPYACALRFGLAGSPGNGFNWNSAQIAPYVQVWDGRTGSDFGGNTGHYNTYNWVTAAFTGWSTLDEAKIIPMYAGFFVQRITTPYSDFSVNNASRDFYPDMPIYKSSETDETGPRNCMQLSLTKDNTDLDEICIMFWNGASVNNDDQFDTPKFFGAEGSSNIYSKTADNVDVVINTLPLTSDTYTVPVYIKAGISSTYTVKAKRTVNFNANTAITLVDTKSNNTQDLRTNPVYSFTANPTDDPARFVVMFSNVNGINAENNSANLYSSGKSIFIQRSNPTISGSVIVYDIYGRTRIQEELGNDNVKVLKTNLSQGVYIVTVVTGNGTFNKKVYIN